MKEIIFEAKQKDGQEWQPEGGLEAGYVSHGETSDDEETHEIHKESLWSKTTPQKEIRTYHMEELPDRVDALIVGGGMAGMLTAYRLQALGLDPIVVEAEEAGSGTTSHTTAKITSLHGPIYGKITKEYGEETAKQYYEMQQAGIFSFKKIIDRNKIDCGYEEKSHTMFTTDQLKKLEKEYEVISRLGIPATFCTSSALPFPIEGGIEFRHQAQFHPLAFLQGLQKIVRVFPHCMVTKIEKNLEVTINGIKKIKPDHLVIATHYPIINSKGFYFTRIHQERSYATALQQSGGFALDGMYIDIDPLGYTFRTYEDYLIFGKGNHRSGKKHVRDYYEELRQNAADWYPEASICSQWANQDCMTLDGIPYIGPYSHKLPNVYVETGFGQWGMTNSMVASKVIGDLITSGKSDYEHVVTPKRHDLSEVPKLLVNGAVTSIGLTKELLHLKEEKLSEIAPGEAGIVPYEGKVAGVYKDEQGNCHVVDPRCTHLGCRLVWNPLEKTWDCPCHGSRFDYDGNLLENPAQRDL